MFSCFSKDEWCNSRPLYPSQPGESHGRNCANFSERGGGGSRWPRTFRATCCKRMKHVTSHSWKKQEAVPTGIAFRCQKCTVSGAEIRATIFNTFLKDISDALAKIPLHNLCTGFRDGSPKYLSASARSFTNFCKNLRNGHRSLPSPGNCFRRVINCRCSTK